MKITKHQILNKINKTFTWKLNNEKDIGENNNFCNNKQLAENINFPIINN